ncbi:MAG: right-handed parallel beta-helix repeat-containing protein [Candidatus Thorarchaeota archaeon]
MKMTLCFMLISVLLVSMWVPVVNPTTSDKLSSELLSKDNLAPNVALSYVPHSEIYIDGDYDFNATAVGEGWEGDGSSETPFLIQGYEIEGEDPISIQNTRYHFEILDCNFTWAGNAIYLGNVTNGYIENCLIDIPSTGISMRNVTGIDVVGCDINVHPSYGYRGVYMDDAIDCSISSCMIQGVTGSDAGIEGRSSEGITLFNNTVFDFDEHGIYFEGSHDIDILNNTVYWNEGAFDPCGIYLSSGELANIVGNNITANSDNGISLVDMDNVTITENHIVDNWIHGIRVDGSDYCIIQDNYIVGNGEGIDTGPECGVFVARSDYCQIIENEFWDNVLSSISLVISNFAYVFNNYMNHSYDSGIDVYMSHNASILANEIYNSDGLGVAPGCGIVVEYSNDTQLLDNILDHNSENGIRIYQSHHGELHANRISDSELYGIHMIAATEWYISHNIIYDNGGPGILLDETLDNYLWYNDIGWSGEFLVVDNGVNQWNYTGVGNWYSDYGGTGVYNFTSGPGTDFYPSTSLVLGTTTPLEYEVGTIGNTMTWAASALNPGPYELLIDGVSQGFETWNGDTIAADVDGLPVGVYNVTLIAYHLSGHWLANQSTLTVVDTEGPVLSVTPVDQTLEYNEALSYQIEASDPSGIDSWAVNDTTNFAISATGLLTNATTLAPGIYYVEITVTDAFSHSTSVTMMITVNELVPPVQPLDPTIMLAIGGAGVGVVIILIVFVLKKKGT